MKTSFFTKSAFTLITLTFFGSVASAQEQQSEKSTKDLSFLIGEWKVERRYNPNSENERLLEGTLICKTSLDGKFINCTYVMERPGRIRGLDEVYFNYNPIYNTYESLWLSSTWPIKVLMQGDLFHIEENLVLKTAADFQIQNGIMEYVKGELTISGNIENQNSFIRNTHIRTSESEKGVWHHHMMETVTKIK